MTCRHRNYRFLFEATLIFSVSALVFAALLPVPTHAGVEASFAYKLSDLSGPIPSMWSRVDVDSSFDEAYSLNISDGLVQIFNEQAMRVHEYGEDYGLASASDLAVAEDGEVFVLFGRRTQGQLLHLNYRGDFIETIDLQEIPEDFAPFRGTYMDYLDGELYLADAFSMRLVVVDLDGRFQRGIDLQAPLLEKVHEQLEEEGLRDSARKRLEDQLEALGQAALGGFSVGEPGVFYFTVPTLFTAYRMTMDGEFRGFGTSGGAKGKFGVIAGIESDAQGNIYVADRLRCVVLIFDREFNFQAEVGYRGDAPYNLVVPDDIAVDARNGKLYVSQAANLGVSVFRLQFN